ncbi:hypothetical protein OCH239_12945 [Roseivivax halodurans JCM 10272]|uniref:Polysaccharide biosynthesis protein n=1 Tax=Roseivivax halodurans JCM 10272 TaxID=1449350 RepID=X7ED91_9RHOB|nr:oligosaccharide flippase family protein [Roseivivax halodurans]ETX13171.1 hypothetical protein OCH239_12945 [Roseivivax halodurans JCM 10272]
MSDPVASLSEVKARHGFFTNVGSLVFARAFLAASQVLVLPVLARHLTVEDFALMALAMSVVIFAGVLSDAGLGRSLIRSPVYNQAEWSTVFWLLAAVGGGLFLGVVIAAPVWSWIFAAPALWPVLSLLACVPFLQALSAAHNAEIERREDYALIARIHLIAAVVGLMVAVGLALVGAGLWALVLQQLVLAGVRFAGLAFFSNFRPSLVFSRDLIGPHLRFARDTVTTSLLATLQGQAATLAVGKLLGTGALGIFAMMQRFARLPQFGLVGPLSTVIYVRMAKAQASLERLVEIYLASTRLIATILFVPLALIAVSGDAIFPVFLGAQWASVAPVFALAIPGIVIEATTITCLVCLFRALGRTDLQFRLVLEGTLLQVPLMVVAATISLEAAAASLTLWALVYVPRGWMLARRLVPLAIRDCLAAVARPLVCTCFAIVAHLYSADMLWPGGLGEIASAILLTVMALAVLFVWDNRNIRAAIALLR